MMNSSNHEQEVQETVQALNSRRLLCAPNHPFFERFSIENTLGSYVETGSVGDVNCGGHYNLAGAPSASSVHPEQTGGDWRDVASRTHHWGR